MKTLSYGLLSLVFLLFVGCSSTQVIELKPSYVINGHEYVDLGLPSGTLWAICNIGADKPEDPGDYFAWADTVSKDTFIWKTYEYCLDSYKAMLKYNMDGEYGAVDNLGELIEDDDAAIAAWGMPWHIPSPDLVQELLKGCQWEWVTEYQGVQISGVVGTSIANGKTIFFPANGYKSGLDLLNHNVSGCYWTSSLNQERCEQAQSLYFEDDRMDLFSDSRCNGLSVRAVAKIE